MWKSIAIWPDTNEVKTHETQEQAIGVVRLLKTQGYGGMGEVFPLACYVKEIV